MKTLNVKVIEKSKDDQNRFFYSSNSLLRVRVKPNSPETKIISENGADLVVAVHAPPEDSKANIELIKFLTKKFGADVKIIRGATSRKKIVRVG